MLQLAIGQSYSQLCQAYSRLCHPPITFNALIAGCASLTPGCASLKVGLDSLSAGWASLTVDYLLTMKECSSKKVLIVKKSLNEAL